MSTTTYQYCYDIHGIIRIQSQYKLPELGYFKTNKLNGPADIVISTGKTSLSTSAQSDASIQKVHYDDGLGRLGFDIQITYTNPMEVVVSRLISFSPHVLYTNVIEPLLRWSFVRKGYVLIHGINCSRRQSGQHDSHHRSDRNGAGRPTLYRYGRHQKKCR